MARTSTASPAKMTAATLAHEAIRLARMVHAQLPEDGDVTGLLALMLLTHARRKARTTAAGGLVPLDEQDRTKWDRGLIDEAPSWSRRRWPARSRCLGLTRCRPPSPPRTRRGHGRGDQTAGETNWPQVHALYLILERIAPVVEIDPLRVGECLLPAAQPRTCALSRAACRVRWSRSGRLGADRAASA
jgi:predicted RNA polymerase sigma factor